MCKPITTAEIDTAMYERDMIAEYPFASAAMTDAEADAIANALTIPAAERVKVLQLGGAGQSPNALRADYLPAGRLRADDGFSLWGRDDYGRLDLAEVQIEVRALAPGAFIGAIAAMIPSCYPSLQHGLRIGDVVRYERGELIVLS